MKLKQIIQKALTLENPCYTQKLCNNRGYYIFQSGQTCCAGSRLFAHSKEAIVTEGVALYALKNR